MTGYGNIDNGKKSNRHGDSGGHVFSEIIGSVLGYDKATDQKTRKKGNESNSADHPVLLTDNDKHQIIIRKWQIKLPLLAGSNAEAEQSTISQPNQGLHYLVAYLFFILTGKREETGKPVGRSNGKNPGNRNEQRKSGKKMANIYSADKHKHKPYQGNKRGCTEIRLKGHKSNNSHQNSEQGIIRVIQVSYITLFFAYEP